MYKFWIYYLGSPNNFGQDPPLPNHNIKLKSKRKSQSEEDVKELDTIELTFIPIFVKCDIIYFFI